MADAGNEIRLEPLRWFRQFEIAHAAEHLVEHAIDFHSGDVLAEADVRTATERDVLVRETVQIQTARTFELTRIEIGGAEVAHHFVAGFDGLTMQLCIFRSGAAHVDDGADEAQQFVSCLLYTSPSPRDKRQSRMPSSA